MARQQGVIRFTGSMGDVSFYKSIDSYLAHTKGGPAREQILYSKKFERTRENSNEFGACTKAGSLLRSATASLNIHSRDSRLTSRLNKLMHALKELDTINTRGQRTVAQGLSDPEGKELLNGFEFNDKAKLTEILKAVYSVDTNTGVTSFNSLESLTGIRFPPGASHACFTAGKAAIDFASHAKEFVSTSPIYISKNQAAGNLMLDALSTTLNGTEIFVLQIRFFQEISGTLYPLKNGEYNCMGILRSS